MPDHRPLIAAQLATAAELFALRRQLAGEPVDAAAALDAAVAGWRRALAHPALAEGPPTVPGAPAAMTAPVAPTHYDRDLPAGAIVGERYRVVRPVGAGGMGEVHLAEDLARGGPVALKRMRAGLRGDPEAMGYFRHEVAAARRVVHPNVAPVLDAVDDGGALFLVMGWLDGRPLRDHLVAATPLPAPRALAIVRGVCAGLAAAHAAGVVHRDVKPENIVIVEHTGTERAVLVDFGVAIVDALDARGAHTGESVVIGTPLYMAPEQIQARPTSPATDVYALALVACELLTGRVPFAADSPIAGLQRKLIGDLALPDALPLRAVLTRALAVDPADRYPDAGALLTALG